MKETTTVFMVTTSFALISALPMQLTISLSKATIKFPQSTEDEGIEDVLGSWKKFQDFQIRFNKTYKSEEEKRQRFKIFKEHLAQILQHNKKSDKSYPKGIHKFSDWTGKCFLKFRCGTSKSQLVIARTFRVKWLWTILTFGRSQHFEALRGHLAPFTIVYALKYW